MNTANKIKNKIEKRERRRGRIKARLFGTAERPRLVVFRSNLHIYAQLVDDGNSKTLAEANDKELKAKKTAKQAEKELSGKIAQAFNVGKGIAEKAKAIKIESVIFDRGGYLYHGRIKSLAEGAREGGLKF